MRTGLLTIFFWAAVAVALSPLESDQILFDGNLTAVDGRAGFEFTLPAGRHFAGWYANVECPGGFVLVVNGTVVAAFGADEVPRTRIKGIDLSAHIAYLRSGQNRVELRGVTAAAPWLRMWLSDNAWYPANFHAHTTYSDGRYSVHDLLQLALGAGARAYAITDHNRTAQCYDTAFHPVGSLNPIRGTEWTSELGHANVLEFQGAAVFDSTLSVQALLDEASWRGGFVQVNHPCDDELGFGWDRYPVLDSGIDFIEVFNNLTYFPPSPGDNDREAVAWWHSLLVAGKTIAATGNSDYHGTIPGEGGPMESQTRVWAPSNHPDTILKYTKLGQAMVLDESDDGRIYIYADTNNNGTWDLVMGQHARITTSRTVKFRAEIEDADFLDDFWVYNRTGTVHNHWFINPLGPWDYAYEWTASYNASSRDFVRAYLENSVNDPELLTNPIYINHPDYELGPTRLLSLAQSWSDSAFVAEPETLRLRLECTAGYSPWRYGLAFAFDTADFALAGWQTAGPGIGAIEQRSSGRYAILEWLGGYTWNNRLPVGSGFDFWVAVTPKRGGHLAALWRSWAHDRIQIIENEPAAGFYGPEGRYWHRDSLFARVIDVQPLSIDLPSPTIDSCAPFAPRATVRNNGNTTVSFPASITIGAYSGAASVTALAPGATQQVAFSPDWQPQRGTHPVRCIALLSGDRVRTNDTLTRPVTVNVRDLAAVAILSPADTIVAGPVIPRAVVRNNGTLREPCVVDFAIDATLPYYDSIALPAGLPFADTTLEFAEWDAPVGSFTATSVASLPGDQVPGNDTARAGFAVRPAGSFDVGVLAIVAPVGTIDSAAPVVPQATVRNYGTLATGCDAWFFIESGGTVVYSAETAVGSLQPGQSTFVTFAEWPKPHAPGNYTARCSVYVALDSNPGNDVLSGEFRITAQTLEPGWTEITQVPLLPSGRAVKDGGAIAWDAGTGRLYVLKGNKTGDFYSFDGTTWTTLTAIPLGVENKPPAKGAGTCTDGNGVVYAVKGNNTQGFWQYSGGTWTQLADIPLGASNKKVKGGTDLVYVDAGDSQYVYLLKGYKTEFYRYNVTSGVWQPLADAPAGQKPKWDKGSWLALDLAGNRIFAHKAKYHELYAYDLATGTWGAQLAGMPLLCNQTGKSKKSKDGGSAAFLADGMLYALKGGNTCDFYGYEPGSNQWAEKETMPQVGSSQKKKRVKGGGDITSDGTHLYALKGNKTVELWRYVPAGPQLPVSNLRPERSAVQGFGREASDAKLVVQNPSRGATTIRLTGLPAGSPSLLTLYDASGRLVCRRIITTGNSSLSTSLSPGVYLVRVTGGAELTRKLVIE